ncbi:MAG TPA: pitrilysin family protein [Candidatus Acidoferrales bacterium]|nr:pitrilysin family protein [Candidatus Acidoferrales bacterium]
MYPAARFFRVAAFAAAALALLPTAVRAATPVTRATLSNGLQVVVVTDPLAPVVTAEINYKVGSDEQWIDGLAHATEHMMFRGSRTLSSSLLMDILSITGGDFDAETSNDVTQYYFTVPSQYLDVALRLERSRATGALMAQQQWDSERGAIEQEVTQDNSDAVYRLFVKMQDRLLGGTPYAKNGLGTLESFGHQIDAAQLRKFYDAWYHPNNAVYVIVGDVDGPSTVRAVQRLFGDVPSATLPPRPAVRLAPLKAAVYHDTSDAPYTAVLLGYRMPGYDSPDYAAAQILGDVLDSERSDFGALPYEGKALGVEFVEQSYRKAGIGIAYAAIPAGSDPRVTDRTVRDIVAAYEKTGVPADLVEAAKLREISALEFNANSIQGLADEWSEAVAVEGRSSPDEAAAEFSRVTVADVDRVLRAYLRNSTVVAAYAVPKNSGATAAGGSGLAKENNQIPPTTHEPLPAWAQAVLDRLQVPSQTLSPSDTILPNGIRLIVQPETISHTVVVSGEILNNPAVQEPAGQDGVASLTQEFMHWGSTTYSRVAFAAELDTIAADVSTGTHFGLESLTQNFDRGMQLLADEELHPAFSASDFPTVKQQLADEVAGDVTSPSHLADVALDDALYPPGDPERRFPTPQTVNALTVSDVKAWYASVYRPDMTTIVVIGDTTPDRARSEVEKYFGGWSSAGPKPNVYPSPVPSNAPAAVTVPATGRVQSSVRLVETIGLHRTDPDWPAMQLANAVLTGGFYSSLLYHDLREVHGYAYDVDSSIDAGKVRSTFGLDYGCDPVNVVPAQSQIVAVLAQMQQRPVDADRLLRSKALLMGDVPIRESSYDGVTDQLSSYALQGLPLDQNVIDARAELAATAADVRAAMAKYVRPEGFVRVVTGPGPR